MRDLRARLDACLRGVCLRGAWHTLPAAFGRADTISRQFRRWGEAGLWEALLHAVALQGTDRSFQGLAYFVCRAMRRCHRVLGLRGLRLARALGMDSALRAPRHWLPDPDLSETVHREQILPGMARLQEWPWRVGLAKVGHWKRLTARCMGRRRIRPWMDPA